MPERFIEYPSAGETYTRDEYGVYEYDVYPRSSVLAGEQRRTFLDAFDTLEEAQAAYPDAVVASGTQYQPVSLDHLPDEDDDGEWFDEPNPNDYPVDYDEQDRNAYESERIELWRNEY